MPGADDILIRSFKTADLRACRKLYQEGLIGGKIAENDTGLDMDDIHRVYMSTPGSHFWVAENESGEVVGMIGVQHHEEGMGEIRRLRVRQDHRRRGIGTNLMETAIQFCRDQQYLKVVLDTFMEREPAIQLFEKFSFRLQRARTVHDKDLLVFYLDLYTGPAKKKS